MSRKFVQCEVACHVTKIGIINLYSIITFIRLVGALEHPSSCPSVFLTFFLGLWILNLITWLCILCQGWSHNRNESWRYEPLHGCWRRTVVDRDVERFHHLRSLMIMWQVPVLVPETRTQPAICQRWSGKHQSCSWSCPGQAREQRQEMCVCVTWVNSECSTMQIPVPLGNQIRKMVVLTDRGSWRIFSDASITIAQWSRARN